jgi:3-oxoacyl-[acyl-carrier protein] reductase
MPLISIDQPRAALVTGGSRGIGRAFAFALAEMGCPVLVNYATNGEAAAEVADTIVAAGGKAIAVQADVTRDADLDRLVSAAHDAFGPIGILVNNTGIANRREVFGNTVADFDETFAVNVRSSYALTQRVIPDMRDQGFGRLVFLSSTAAKTGGVISAPYAGSKAAVEGMAHHYATYLAPHGVTTNIISPAFIATAMMAGGTLPPHMPVKRFGTAEECAMVLQMIVANGFLNGQTIQVNGGIYQT